MKSKQRSTRWLLAAALLVGLVPALGAYAAPAEVQANTQATSLWQDLLSWVDGWWSPAADLTRVQAAAGGPKTGGGGGEQGLGLDPDGTDPDPGDGSGEEDPGLPPGTGG